MHLSMTNGMDIQVEWISNEIWSAISIILILQMRKLSLEPGKDIMKVSWQKE